MIDEKLTQVNYGGESVPVDFVESVDVINGVRCDVYRFPQDETKDLGVIIIESGFKTPLQKVLKGDRTTEVFYTGKGKLTITKENGEKEVHEVDDKSGKNFAIDVKIGEIMQWQAAPDSTLTVGEVCYPPYQDGRYENLEEFIL